jgi:hypothetical protein
MRIRPSTHQVSLQPHITPRPNTTTISRGGDQGGGQGDDSDTVVQREGGRTAGMDAERQYRRNQVMTDSATGTQQLRGMRMSTSPRFHGHNADGEYHAYLLNVLGWTVEACTETTQRYASRLSSTERGPGNFTAAFEDGGLDPAYVRARRDVSQPAQSSAAGPTTADGNCEQKSSIRGRTSNTAGDDACAIRSSPAQVPSPSSAT